MKNRRNTIIALAFLLPNLIGFLVFTFGPILFSLYISLTDWALTKQNALNDEPIRFIGFENYERLLTGDESVRFWDYFGNTVYLMLGIPVGIAGSLLLALMLNTRMTPRRTSTRTTTSIGVLLLAILATFGTWIITHPGAAPETAQAVLSAEEGLGAFTEWEVDRMRSVGAVIMVATLGAMAFLGVAVGSVFFRTLYYLPSLLAGVAMYLLWKTLFRPRGGLINAILEPPLDALQVSVEATPAFLWYALGALIGLATIAFCGWVTLNGIRKIAAGESGLVAFFGRLCFVASVAASGLGIGYVTAQLPEKALLPTGTSGLTAAHITEVITELDGTPGIDTEFMQALASQIGDNASPEDVIANLIVAATPDTHAALEAAVYERSEPTYLGLTSGDGLMPPEWLISSTWAKTAILIMGIWLGIGGSNMLLYLAGLSNIPPELYEAASIDGASGWARFANVTWPQLAPTTFFIVIMSTIGGLQGGFEQAMAMTEGKADTITLTYYLYNVAFEDEFQLGLASAIAWIMFAMIFVMTALNFRVGSQMVNE